MVLILYGFVVFLATLLGSFVGLGGGLLGNYHLNYALSVSSTPNTVRGIQSAILAVFLVCVIIFVSGNFKTFNVKNPIAILLSGLLLGIAAAFLCIRWLLFSFPNAQTLYPHI